MSLANRVGVVRKVRRTRHKANSPKRKTTAPHSTELFSDIAWTEVARSLKLSARELEITRGVFDNLTAETIAVILGVSENTIHTHLHRLFGKLRVTTRTQMVVRVMQELLVLILSDAGCMPPSCRHRANGRCPMRD